MRLYDVVGSPSREAAPYLIVDTIECRTPSRPPLPHRSYPSDRRQPRLLPSWSPWRTSRQPAPQRRRLPLECRPRSSLWSRGISTSIENRHDASERHDVTAEFPTGPYLLLVPACRIPIMIRHERPLRHPAHHPQLERVSPVYARTTTARAEPATYQDR